MAHALDESPSRRERTVFDRRDAEHDLVVRVLEALERSEVLLELVVDAG